MWRTEPKETVEFVAAPYSAGSESAWLVSYEEWVATRPNVGLVKKLLTKSPLAVALLLFAVFCLLGSGGSNRVDVLCILVVVACLALARCLSVGYRIQDGEKWKNTSDTGDWSDKHWLVSINYVEEDFVYGSDSGVVWVEDDHLYFSGQYSSFALTREDLAGGAANLFLSGRSFYGVYNQYNLALDKRGPVGSRVVSIGYDERLPGNHAFHQSQLKTALHDFIWSDSKVGGGQLPPGRLGPGAATLSTTAGHLLLELLFVGLFVGALGLVAAFFGQVSWNEPGDFVKIVALCVGVGGGYLLLSRVWRRVRAIRTRRRIRAFERVHQDG